MESKNYNPPKHVAVIMDGNGRWAKKRGNQRVFGHKNAIQAVRQVVEGSREYGIKYLTLYTFSKENWSRPKYEVNSLMYLLVKTLQTEIDELLKNDIRFNVIGDLDSLSKESQKLLYQSLDKTAHCKSLVLTLALSYSSKWDILQAINTIIQSDELIQQYRKFPIDENLFLRHLTTADLPSPELLIRTGGELRLSNFLLWEMAYTEFYFTSVLWPDFNKKLFFEALESFQKRDRRFGKVETH